MTNTEMLNKLLTQSGWTITGKTENGSVVCKAAETAKAK